MIVSPYLSTQLNETNCGCRCSCGCSCGGPGDDEDYDQMSDDESETAVESSSSDDDEGFPPDQHADNNVPNDDNSAHMDRDIVSPRAMSHQARLLLMGRAEDLQVGEALAGWEQISVRPSLYNSLEEAADSLFTEAPSDETHSNAISDHGSLRMMSPGPGIGALFVSDGTEDIEFVYYFDRRPLRLSAEYEHARGKAAEHSLIPDEASSRDLSY
jgi:hypothetical protein